MIPRRRTGNGAAIAFFGLISIFSLTLGACGSTFGDAFEGTRGGDAVISPTVPETETGTTGSADGGTASKHSPTDDDGEGPRVEPVNDDPTPTETAPGAAVPWRDAQVSVTAAWIYDGDTFRASTQDGRSVDVRLIGINAPEADECYGQESTNMLIDLIGRKQVQLSIIATDEYGRRLADVVLDNVDVNLTMVSQGGALALHSERGERLSALSAAENEARENRRGMWARGCNESAPVAIDTVHYDADGRDDVNVNGEWVVIVNNGPEIALRDWGMRDESTRHRFAFPDDFVLGANERVIIHSGCETDPRPIGNPPTVDHTLYWCDPWGPLWSNRGDSAYLVNADGATVDVFAWP